MNTILPIGSVVKLNDIQFPVMIFGFLQQNGLQPGRYVDYVGVPYPVGNVGLQAQLGFQMEDITEVLFEGYRTDSFNLWEEVIRLKKQAEYAKTDGVHEE